MLDILHRIVSFSNSHCIFIPDTNHSKVISMNHMVNYCIVPGILKTGILYLISHMDVSKKIDQSSPVTMQIYRCCIL